ncbi:MAG: hypothetical protein HY920_01075, partial [Elusimicrobia bacterium]|nr:hypothetical protein [Elusimicrobiota bacterium]
MEIEKKLLCGILLTIIACASGRRGRVEVATGGTIKKGVAELECTEPRKPYVPEIKAFLKAEIDDLK